MSEFAPAFFQARAKHDIAGRICLTDTEATHLCNLVGINLQPVIALWMPLLSGLLRLVPT